MKKFLFILAILVISVNSFAWDFKDFNIPEPEFEGEVYVMTDTTTYISLQTEHAKSKTTAKWGVAMFGVASGSTYWEIKGNASPVTLNKNIYTDGLYIIVSCENNNRDPRRILQIIPLEIQKNRRIYNVSKYNTFSGASSMDAQVLNFEARKYKDHSYIIKINSDELQKLRENNEKEFKKFGKQFIINILTTSMNNINSNQNDFITFGIEPLTSK